MRLILSVNHSLVCASVWQALRISMEEQRQRQEDETKQVIEDTAGEATPKPTTTVAVPPSGKRVGSDFCSLVHVKQLK